MRKDGIKVEVEQPMYALIPFFMTHRYDSMNMITVDIPEEPLRNYMNQKRREGRPISHMALMTTAYLRLMEEYPALNRFIGNKTVYQHRDKTVSLVVLRPGDVSQETMAKIYLDDGDTVFDVQQKITDFIESSRNAENQNRMDKAMRVLLKLRLLTGTALALIRFLDRYGLLPNWLIKASPFHASLLISNLASIRTNSIYHHVYEFGTTSVAITMGNMREVPRRSKDGIVFDRCIPLGIVMDERIAPGVYFAQAFGRFRQLLSTPELLELPGQMKK